MKFKTHLLLFLLFPLACFAEILSLDQFLSEVSHKSLDFKIENSKSEIAKAESLGIRIGAPMVGFNRMTMSDGDSFNGFEISQTIPFPTKITSDYAARKNEFKAQNESKLSSQKQTLLNAKMLYLTLWQNQERVKLLIDKKNLLVHHIKLARSTARSDSFGAVHLLKTETDLDILETEIESNLQTIREKQFEMAQMVSAEPSAFKIEATEPKISVAPNNFSFEDSHYFKFKKFNLESLKSRETVAKSEWLPDFNLKYKQMEATSTDLAYKEIMVGVTLPFLFPWQPYAGSRQASFKSKLAEYEFEKDQRSFKSEKMTLLSRIDSLKKQLDILNNKLIPRAEKRLKLVQNIVPRDMETLQDHRETSEAYPDLKMKALNFRIEYEKSVADLEKYTSPKDSNNE